MRSEYWRSHNRKRRELWRKEGKCVVHGRIKPCEKCRDRYSKRKGKGWCDECTMFGGHRSDCPLLLKSSARKSSARKSRLLLKST